MIFDWRQDEVEEREEQQEPIQDGDATQEAAGTSFVYCTWFQTINMYISICKINYNNK